MDTFRGVVYPAHSDAMGHMTTQYYVAAFDQAMWHLVSALGFQPDWIETWNQGWVDVRYEIDFRRELTVGALYRVESSVLRVGRSSLVSSHRLLSSDESVSGEAILKSVYFDLARRESIPIPDNIRQRAHTIIESGSV